MKFTAEQLRDLRQIQMSMVFQKFALLPHRTVLENAGTGTSRARRQREPTPTTKATKWLDRVGLNGFENHYPHQLSGGMQQRVGIARALTSNSPIMLMDEAFSALDPLIRTDMQDLLLELQKDLHKTIVFITHDLDEALKLADHLVILKDGDIVQQGEPQHILLNPNDPYIEDFVSDINRARVLRVRSVMTPLEAASTESRQATSTIDDTLERRDRCVRRRHDVHTVWCVADGQPVGVLDMKDLVQGARAARRLRAGRARQRFGLRTMGPDLRGDRYVMRERIGCARSDRRVRRRRRVRCARGSSCGGCRGGGRRPGS